MQIVRCAPGFSAFQSYERQLRRVPSPRRQRHSAIDNTTIVSVNAIALLKNRPPGRSMVRDQSEGASPGRARRKATMLSPIEVPASE